MEALFARLLKGSAGGDATDSGCVPGAALSAVACAAAVSLQMIGDLGGKGSLTCRGMAGRQLKAL